MRRRRTTNTELGSLELLLDTICNTFGGIIFLAILVALLLQLSGPTEASSAIDPEKIRAASLHLARIQDELEAIKRIVAQQDQLVEKMGQPVAGPKTENIAELKRRYAELTVSRAQTVASLDALESKRVSAKQEAVSLDATVRELRQRVAELERQIKEETAARSQEARLPMLRQTTKREMPILLKQGRLSRLFKSSARDVNTREVDAQALGTGGGSVRPKPGAGVQIKPGGASHDQIIAALSGYSKDADYLAIFVWPDSFNAFAELRSVVVEQGFEYRLLPLPDDVDVVREGGGSAQVQ